MDLAYLTATLKSTYFPPYDPWFSGGYINYYYFGFVLIGVPIKALGIEPGVAYNLAIPALFGMTASTAFGAGASLFAGWRAKRDADDILLPQGTLWAGGLAALLVVGLGNIDAISVLYSNWLRMGDQPEAGTLNNLINGIQKWLVNATANFGWGHYWNPTRLTLQRKVEHHVGNQNVFLCRLLPFRRIRKSKHSLLIRHVALSDPGCIAGLAHSRISRIDTYQN